MSAIPPPPPATPPPAVDAPVDPPVDGTKTASWWDQLTAGLSVSAFGFLLIFPIVLTIVFHFGAAYLSYQKYQSGLWALVDFFFAVFYYPYYAFFLASAPAPSQGVFAGGRRRKH